MAQPRPPVPVKFFVAVLYHDPEAFDRALVMVAEKWGGHDFIGLDHLFDVTDYYAPEMGSPLYRKIAALESLAPPGALVDMKLHCNDLEDRFAHGGNRAVNLDAGYLDHNKVVLASAKEAGQKVYLDKGIYADLAGRYRSGRYQPFEWSFPDFRDGRYDSELLAVRTRYLEQLRRWRESNGGAGHEKPMK